ncbi:MAG TPA: lipopolysaccharide biosynthesis protein [Methylophilaceae bacterium]|jgi:PST family polysaccharide transporter
MLTTSQVIQPQATNVTTQGKYGLVMMVASRLSGMLIALLSSAILGRLLKPADYGLVAMASSVMILLNLLKDFGLTSAVVQTKEITEDQLNAVFWLNLFIAIGFASVGAISAPFVATFYKQVEVTNVVYALSASLVVVSIAGAHSAMLRRRLSFYPLMWSEVLGQLSGLVSGVTIAFYYHSYWAIVVAQIASATATTFYIFIHLRWLPGIPKSFLSATKLLKFGMNVSVFSLLNFLSNQLGAIMIGWWFGASAAGHFNRAQQLLSLTGSGLMQPVSQTALPVLSRLQNSDAEYQLYYSNLLERTSIFFGVLGAFVIICGDSVALILLGSQWQLSGDIYRWFGLSIIAVGMASQTGNVLISQNRTSELRSWGFGDALIRAGASATGIVLGITGVAAAFGVSTLFITVPIISWIVSRKGPVGLRSQFLAMRSGAILAFFIASIGLLIRSVAWSASPVLAVIYSLMIVLTVVIVVYFIDTKTSKILDRTIIDIMKMTQRKGS